MGASRERTLRAIKRRFPGSAAAFERGFAASESFRGLCEEYLDCVAALEGWRDSGSTEAPARLAEYASLLAELTEELEARLRPHAGADPADVK